MSLSEYENISKRCLEVSQKELNFERQLDETMEYLKDFSNKES